MPGELQGFQCFHDLPGNDGSATVYSINSAIFRSPPLKQRIQPGRMIGFVFRPVEAAKFGCLQNFDTQPIHFGVKPGDKIEFGILTPELR